MILFSELRRKSGRKRKVRVFSDLGDSLRVRANGSRIPLKPKRKKVHGNVKGEREVRKAAKERCEHLDLHIEHQQQKV